MNLVPDTCLLPVAEMPPAGHTTAASHFLRQQLPGNARAQNKDDPGECGPIVHRWSATFGSWFFRWQEWLNNRPQIISQERFSHASILHQFEVLLERVWKFGELAFRE